MEPKLFQQFSTSWYSGTTHVFAANVRASRPYSDWSFDEVYAYVADSIPELAERWREMESYKFRHGAGFHACWVWCRNERKMNPTIGECGGTWFAVIDIVNSVNELPSEHHAVAAACLIAKGIEVPK